MLHIWISSTRRVSSPILIKWLFLPPSFLQMQKSFNVEILKLFFLVISRHKAIHSVRIRWIVVSRSIRCQFLHILQVIDQQLSRCYVVMYQGIWVYLPDNAVPSSFRFMTLRFSSIVVRLFLQPKENPIVFSRGYCRRKTGKRNHRLKSKKPNGARAQTNSNTPLLVSLVFLCTADVYTLQISMCTSAGHEKHGS